MSENPIGGKCPCCGRHCDMDDLHYQRGRQYKETGVIPEKNESRGFPDGEKHVHGEHHRGRHGRNREKDAD